MNTTISKSINDLVPDVNKLLRENKRLASERIEDLSSKLTTMLASRLGEEKSSPILRMSNFGTKCDRKLWYTVNKPEDREPLRAETRLKFLYGDILEELILTLAEEAGHKVEGRQDVVDLDGVTGHIDAIIDGVLVDVKSANSRSFQKFKATTFDDAFGYIDQLNLYLESLKLDQRLKVKRAGAFLAIDKELGHIHLRLVSKDDVDWTKKIADKKQMVAGLQPPERTYRDLEDGASGNMKLGTVCSYCDFKKTCWPGLRTFVSSQGPKYLTVVKREPNMLEV